MNNSTQLNLILIESKGVENEAVDQDLDVVPGEMLPMAGQLEINRGRRCIQLTVSSSCDRPIQIGSHYHFIEANPLLSFDRRLAYGMRLVS